MKKIHVAPATAVAFLVGIGVATAGTATAAQMITGKQIRNGSITAKDLSKGLRAQLGVPGPAGPSGPSGPVGPAGPAGSVSTVEARTFTMLGTGVGVESLSGECQPGERVLSAGYTSGNSSAGALQVQRFFPTKDGEWPVNGAENTDGWFMMFTLGSPQSVYLTILCAR